MRETHLSMTLKRALKPPTCLPGHIVHIWMHGGMENSTASYIFKEQRCTKHNLQTDTVDRQLMFWKYYNGTFVLILEFKTKSLYPETGEPLNIQMYT